MATFKPKSPSTVPVENNGLEEGTGSPSPSEEGGAQGAWGHLAATFQDLFVDLARAVNGPKLDGLEKTLHNLPKPGSPTPPDLEKYIQAVAKQGARYVQDARQYLLDRENELKEVIRLLSKTIAEMSQEGNTFAKSILETTNRLSDIYLLEDLRAIREALSAEVKVIKEAVRQQEESRVLRMTELTKRVDVLQEELEAVSEESVRDPLTGLYNRRSFDHELNGLLERNRILPSPFLLVIFDLDDFKRINDRLGHTVGDKALQAVAKVSRENLRSTDFTARYGGDEFVVILPADSQKKGKKRMENLLTALSRISIPIVHEGKNLQLALTLSIGIARYREGDTAESLIHRADEALYHSKKMGKNRVSTEEDLS
ncbi:MAG: GGDEF domain-containing protein [Candidatus Tectomicrobia bacterium]|nr:GGDEF domain-containing protein [Candidatus Tectomicrobia bacterium]